MRKTFKDIKKLKKNKTPISCVTVYDYSMAKIINEVDIDMILVGDSLGTVIKGDKTTLNVTMSNMIHHTKAVVKGNKNSLIAADMPFLSYQLSIEEALENAGELIRKTGCSAVKFEGKYIKLTERLMKMGIPVVAHLGFTPQSVKKFGRDIVRGKRKTERKTIIEDSIELEEAGAEMLILEAVPETLAKEITKKLKIPVIGIGSGRYCDGEIQVLYDILGIYPDFNPKHSKIFENVGARIKNGVQKYHDAVKKKKFPEENNVLKK